MDSKELAIAVNEIFDRHEKQKEIEIQAIAERARKYPDGFEFYYPSTVDGVLDRSSILCAYLSGFAVGDTQVWYNCHIPSWTPDVGECMPLSESVINRAIAKYGIPS